MQHHHPGSWYLPWGVPLQKMLAVPMHHPGAVGYQHQGAAIQVPTQPQQHQQHQQAPPPQTYQHQIHPALQHHSNAAAAAAALHQQLHPAAAAAMFTPLSLRQFMNPSASHLSLGQQQTLQSAVQPATNQNLQTQNQSQLGAINLNVGVVPIRQSSAAGAGSISTGTMIMPVKKVSLYRFFFLMHLIYLRNLIIYKKKNLIKKCIKDVPEKNK